MGDLRDSGRFGPDELRRGSAAAEATFADGSLTASGLRREGARRTRQAILPTVPLILGLPEAEAAVAIGV